MSAISAGRASRERRRPPGRPARTGARRLPAAWGPPSPGRGAETPSRPRPRRAGGRPLPSRARWPKRCCRFRRTCPRRPPTTRRLPLRPRPRVREGFASAAGNRNAGSITLFPPGAQVQPGHGAENARGRLDRKRGEVDRAEAEDDERRLEPPRRGEVAAACGARSRRSAHDRGADAPPRGAEPRPRPREARRQVRVRAVLERAARVLGRALRDRRELAGGVPTTRTASAASAESLLLVAARLREKRVAELALVRPIAVHGEPVERRRDGDGTTYRAGAPRATPGAPRDSAPGRRSPRAGTAPESRSRAGPISPEKISAYSYRRASIGSRRLAFRAG